MILEDFNKKPKMAVWRKSGSSIQKVHEPAEKMVPFKYNQMVVVDKNEKAD